MLQIKKKPRQCFSEISNIVIDTHYLEEHNLCKI